MNLKYMKLSGTGNTFIVLDFLFYKSPFHSDFLFKKNMRSKWSQMLCKKFHSDGLFFVSKPSVSKSSFSNASLNSKLDFEADFYNKDGSRAEMCGNGASSLVCFAYKRSENQKKKKRFLFKLALSDLMEAKIVHPIPLDSVKVQNKVKGRQLREGRKNKKEKSAYVQLKCHPVQVIQWNQEVQIFNQKVYFHFLDSGVPHTVIEIFHQWNQKHLLKMAHFLRKKRKFSKKKTNITFYQPIGKNSIKAISFERGIEGFTKACGTGALAASFCHYKKNPAFRSIFVQMPGGMLHVDLKLKKPLLESKIKILEEGTLHFLNKQDIKNMKFLKK